MGDYLDLFPQKCWSDETVLKRRKQFVITGKLYLVFRYVFPCSSVIIKAMLKKPNKT